ncbi:single-stranded DNA-binding protein [Candidatus Gracilibacteria bacterium]|nr:single-stranded DNA-binding protein [Candidatus Gracilibacteria bacterium]
MRHVNTVILIGNITRDPESKKTLSGDSICTFGLATNREWMTNDNRKMKNAEFHEITCWGRLAELMANMLRKGMLVHVQGFLKTRSWDDNSGLKRFKTEVIAEDIVVLERRDRVTIDTVSAAPTRNSSDIMDDEMIPSIQIENPNTL